MKMSRRNAFAVIAGATVLILASSTTTAVATRMITGAQIQNRSITGADLKPGTIRLQHLHESAERSGVVYGTLPPEGASRARSGPRPQPAQPLSTANDATIVSLLNVPKGSYLVSVTGQMKLYPTVSTSLTVSCDLLYSMGSVLVLPYYNVPAPLTSNNYTTLANEAIITVSSTSNLTFRCQVFDLSPSAPAPSSAQIGDAYANIVATPVSAYYHN
jgi:hypothetical protein